jgi:SAM-dependent methyltransferase
MIKYQDEQPPRDRQPGIVSSQPVPDSHAVFTHTTEDGREYRSDFGSQATEASHAPSAPGWTSVPVDDVGYFESAELMEKSDDELRELIAGMREARYGGWRNDGGKWRDIMALDTGGRTVLDYGCGTGLEALELARAGNRVFVTDVHQANVDLAMRVLRIHGYRADGTVLWGQVMPFDTFHLAGVLHHIRYPEDVMRWAWRYMKPGGEVRMMVYSDQGWRIATGSEPPEVAHRHPDFWRYVRFFDSVGSYADWYDAARLRERFGQWFSLERCEYMTPDGRYLGAVLRRKDE